MAMSPHGGSDSETAREASVHIKIPPSVDVTIFFFPGRQKALHNQATVKEPIHSGLRIPHYGD